MPHMEFESAKSSGEEVTFTIGEDPFVFKAIPVLPAGSFIDLLSGQGGNLLKSTANFLDFVLEPDSRDHFAARMRDPQNPIDMETLERIGAWLLGVYTGRPTELPSPSPAGQEAPTETSTESSPSEA